MDNQIGINAEDRAVVSMELSKMLADTFVLYVKTRRAHWNVEGADFYTQHKFFETQYEQLDDIMDSIAERIRSLGHFPPATLKEFLAHTHLTEAMSEKNDSAGFITELLRDHNAIIMHIRGNINRFASVHNDLGSSDFITGLLETHEKMAWMLRAHLVQ